MTNTIEQENLEQDNIEPMTMEEAVAGYTTSLNMMVEVAKAMGIPVEEIAGALATNLYDILAMDNGGHVEGLVVEVRSHGELTNIRVVMEGKEALA